jgi:hypothetical protein
MFIFLQNASALAAIRKLKQKSGRENLKANVNCIICSFCMASKTEKQ